jgi:hypothetical protein
MLCPDPQLLHDNAKTQLGAAMNAALRKANIPENISILIVCKNISRNFLLTLSQNTTTPKLLAHLPLIHEAAHTIHQLLLLPCLNEKWHKLAIHSIPTDVFPNSIKGMILLSQEVECNYQVILAQPPQYILNPNKRIGKATSSMMIALKSAEEAQHLKCSKVVVLYKHRKVTEFYTSYTTNQCHQCLLFRHHHAMCNSQRGPTYALCTGPHSTENHTYVDYPTRSSHTCYHSTYKYANCIQAGYTNTLHAAYDSHCPVKATIIHAAWQKTRATPLPNSIPSKMNPINDTTMTADK